MSKNKATLKFISFSLFGIFMFFASITIGDVTTIPIDHLVKAILKIPYFKAIYGFLIIIALITIFQIINSMNASVSAHMKQYGIMRSMGMSSKQLRRMIAAQAMSYALSGCIAGCLLGLPLNKMMFRF